LTRSLTALNLGVSINQYPKHKACEGKLLIVGSGRCVWDDLLKVNRNDFDIMCLNDMIMHYPERVNHAYSNDWKMLENWLNARRPREAKEFGRPTPHTCYGPNSWPWPGHGTSALNACYTALALGYSEVVLAGIPLDDSGHYWAATWKKSNFVKEAATRYWTGARDNVFEGRVRSISGRSHELLG